MSRKPDPLINRDNGRLTLDHLSPSSISLFWRCPFAFFNKYALNAPTTRPGHVTRGVAGHSAAEKNSDTMLETGSYMKLHEVEEYADDRFTKQLQFDLEEYLDVEWEKSEEDERKKLRQQVVRYRKQIAPSVIPQRTEVSWSIPAPSGDWKLVGYIDLVAQDPMMQSAVLLDDFKFSKGYITKQKDGYYDRIRMKQDLDMQAALYTAGSRVLGLNPRGFTFFFIPPGKDTRHRELSMPVSLEEEKLALKTASQCAFVIQQMLNVINGEPTADNCGGFFRRFNTWPGERFNCGRGKCDYADVCMKGIESLLV